MSFASDLLEVLEREARLHGMALDPRRSIRVPIIDPSKARPGPGGGIQLATGEWNIPVRQVLDRVEEQRGK